MTTTRNPDAPQCYYAPRYPRREELQLYIESGWVYLGPDPFLREGRFQVGWPSPARH
jgi:hypothetical protein